MTNKTNGHVVYELSGRALAAARQLEDELRAELGRVPVKQSGNLWEIGDSWESLYKGLLTRLDQEAPALLKRTGLKSPVTQVFEGVQTLPRAYVEYPQIFTSPEEKPRYFMYAPVDYKGNHFAPADSKRLTDTEADRAGNLLFAGGWLGNAPIVGIKKQGVATPADYVSPGKKALRKAFSSAVNDRVCFLAAGRSLEIVEDYRARTKDWESKLKTVCRAIESETAKQRDKLLAALPAGEDVRISATYRYSFGGGDKAELLLSARCEGKLDIWSAGKTVSIPECAGYTLGESLGGEYSVLPRRDTPEGRKLAALIDDVPLTPGLRDYPELFASYKIKENQFSQFLGANNVVPQVVDVDGYCVLLYNAAPDDKAQPFCPPGARPFPAEIYEWLRADEGDRNMGITPPPRPAKVSRFLSAAQTSIAGKRRPGP